MQGTTAYILAKGASKAYTDQVVTSIANGFTYKGSVATIEALPTSAEKGDLYNIQTGGCYAWDGSKWYPVTLKGANGVTFTPSVSEEGVLSWTNDGGKENPPSVNIKGPQGEKGEDGEDGEQGVTFTPTVSSEGVISWTNDGGKENPESRNIKGPKGDKGDAGHYTAGENITIENDVISASGANKVKYEDGLTLFKDDSEISGQTEKIKFKTINDNSVIGDGNIQIKTFQAFPTGDPEQGKGFKTDGTLEELVNSIVNYEKGYEGSGFLGGISGECCPFEGNAECKVEYMADGLAVLTVSSSNVAPYHWELNTAEGVWRKFSDVIANPTEEAETSLTKIKIDGELYKIEGKTYSAGSNITINDQNQISAKDTVYSAGSNISILNDVISSKELMARTFVTNMTVGNLPSGTQINATDSVADILYRILYGTTPPTTVTIYHGPSSTVPTTLSGLSSEQLDPDNVVGDHYYNIVCSDPDNGQYPVFAVPNTYKLTKWIATEAPEFPLGYLTKTIDNYNVYYFEYPSYDYPDGIDYTFTVSIEEA